MMSPTGMAQTQTTPAPVVREIFAAAGVERLGSTSVLDATCGESGHIVEVESDGSRGDGEPSANPARYFTSTSAPCSSSFGLHCGRFVLRHAGLHDARGAVDEILRFLETEAGQLAHDLDDLDLLGAGFLERDRELGLLFGGRGRGGTRATSCGSRADRRGGDGDVELAS